MVKVLLQTKELVKELMLEKFVHIIDGEIPPTYPLLSKSIPELALCDYCWLWLLPNGLTICLYFSNTNLTTLGYRFALLRERPKVIHIPDTLTLKDRVIKTISYQRHEFDTATESVGWSSPKYGMVIEFTGYCHDTEAEIGFWECAEEVNIPDKSPQNFAKLRANQTAETITSINKKYRQ